jgi:hypothetical protein
MHRPVGTLRVVLGLLLSFLVLQASGKKDKPDITTTDLEGQPSNLQYFEDSDVALFTDEAAHTAYRSSDGGANWKPLSGVEKDSVLDILMHPSDKRVAVALGGRKKHWMTSDRGETWEEFTTPEMASRIRSGIAFHATDPKRMLFMAQSCTGPFCEDLVYYTLDGFKTTQPLRDNLVNCLWAKSMELFSTGDKDVDLDLILCVATGKFSFFSSDLRIVMSSDFFKTEEEPRVDGITIQGVTNLAAVKRYLVFAAKSKATVELALYVTDDAKTWRRAEFGEHKLEENAYTLLESTNYSMQVDVMPSRSPIGNLLTSDSNGTQFTKNIDHTNRNYEGFVDFEKLANVQGVVLVNLVDNHKEVEKSRDAKKDLISKISFDDGHTWEDLKAGSKQLHLHSVTEQRNIGRLFSSSAPGMVMGVGNTGKTLTSYEKGDLYVSDDAGLNWKLAIEGPHLYEFGGQGSVLVAIADDETDEISWSLDHGANWSKTKLEKKVVPFALTTTPDSTSLKFLLIASIGKGKKATWQTVSLDFDGLHERECKDKDFEVWPARVDDKGKPICVMGHIQKFKRRKADADCIVVNDNFADPEEESEKCECTNQDFECDYNFKLEDDKCVPAGPIQAPKDACQKEGASFEGSSGYRLVPGNQCKGGVDLAKPVSRPCGDTKAPFKNGEISSDVTNFRGGKVVEYYYLEREPTARGDDETVVMRTQERDVWITHDHGKTWHEILKGEDVLAIYPHQYIHDYVYFITPKDKVFYSAERGLEKNYKYFKAPEAPTHEQIQIIQFHPKNKDWLIWTGGRDCSGSSKADCTSMAHVSFKGGDDWEKLLPAVRKCLFVYREDRPESEKRIFCEQYENENHEEPLQLISSDDMFVHKNTLKSNVINFASMSEYIVVAIRDEDQKSLKVDASIDGVTFADARFPHNFNVPHQQAYTVLDSSTHAVFLHVTVNGKEDQEYGSLLKSNSNGTSYVLSASEVNRNRNGFVDFEKMQGIEGVALINRVANAKDVDGGASKKLKTYITHNDGAAWALIPRPNDPPSEIGKPFDCRSSGDKCALHLHGYTERADPRDTFSSASAIGMMLATGNVGEFLGRKDEADTFITRDGGLSWNMVATGNWMWEYGDQGSIIVIVKQGESTNSVRYSLDEGASWKEYKFGADMIVDDISTLPSDTSRNFLLWGRIGGKVSTVNIDFSGLKERSEKCQIDESNTGKSDFDLWSPKHPLSGDDCLFGHVTEYHRKKLDRNCFIGRQPETLHSIARNCTCTREDFECDYNYESDEHGQCNLVPGLSKADPAEVCKKNPELTEYYGITGYRRIPLSTCQGGRDLEYTSVTHPCPDHEEEFNRKHSISGAGLFFAIVLPIAAAAGIGFWAFKNWDGKFGRIQLGDNFGSRSSGAFDRDAPWIKYPVIALSGVVAVIAALPMLAGSLWRLIETRLGRHRSGGFSNRPYTSRSSFQRGDYAVMDPDEGEFLGDSDDDV